MQKRLSPTLCSMLSAYAPTHRILKLALVGLLLTSLGLVGAHAATYTWTGGAFNHAWADILNWNPSTGFPGSGDIAVFAGAGDWVVLGGNRPVKTIRMSGSGS